MNANNRYKIICSKNINIRSVHSNVLMECYLLSWDQLTKKSILQIKFRNLEIKTIKSIHILYYTVDLDGNINTDPCFTTYQDLNAEPNSSFGSKIPIVIDSELIGDVKIFINKIIWDDNVLQEIPQESYTEIQPQEPIESLLDEQQCAHYQTLCNLPSVPKYYPLKVDETLWRCTCGSFSNSDICYNCSAYKNDIFSYCDSNYLINYSQNLQAAQNKKHKRKKQALILTSCLIVISISIGLLWNAFLKDFYYTGRAIMNIKDFSDEGEETYYDYLFKIENIPLYFYLEDKRDAAFKKKKAALHATSKIINQDRYVDLFQFALNTGILICEDGNSVIFSSCSDLNTYTDIWGEDLKGWNNIVKVIESNLFGTVAITKKHKVISSLANIEDDYRFEYVKQIESLKSIKDIYQYDGWFGFSGALIALHDDGSVSLIPESR